MARVMEPHVDVVLCKQTLQCARPLGDGGDPLSMCTMSNDPYIADI